MFSSQSQNPLRKLLRHCDLKKSKVETDWTTQTVIEANQASNLRRKHRTSHCLMSLGASERASEVCKRCKKSKRSEWCGASEWVGRANKRANGPIPTAPLQPVLNLSACGCLVPFLTTPVKTMTQMNLFHNKSNRKTTSTLADKREEEFSAPINGGPHRYEYHHYFRFSLLCRLHSTIGRCERFVFVFMVWNQESIKSMCV